MKKERINRVSELMVKVLNLDYDSFYARIEGDIEYARNLEGMSEATEAEILRITGRTVHEIECIQLDRQMESYVTPFIADRYGAICRRRKNGSTLPVCRNGHSVWEDEDLPF